jgi:hypothetical protein
VARLAIAKGFLGEYAKLDQSVQRAVDAAITAFARNAHPGQQLELPRHSRNDRIRLMPVDTRWRGVVLAPATQPTGAATGRAPAAPDTYCLVTVLPQDKVDAYVAGRRFSVNRARGVLEVHDDPDTAADTAAGPQAVREAARRSCSASSRTRSRRGSRSCTRTSATSPTSPVTPARRR